MPIDDMPDPDPPAPATPTGAVPPTPCEGDIAFQSGVDSSVAARSWIDMAISILTAEIDPGPVGSLEHRTIQDLRVQAAARAARLMRSDLPPTDGP